MKLSIWQQFSSNHSAHYTVVGEFESVDKAHKAYVGILKLMEENSQWYIEHDEYPQSRNQPTPIEREYAHLHNFDWKEPVDWSMYDVSKAISIFDRLVIVDTSHVDTWQTGHQFANILNSMNAKVARDVMEGKELGIEDEIWMSFHFKIECETDSIEVAQKLRQDFQQVFNDREDLDSQQFMPWLSFHPSLVDRNYTNDMIAQLKQDYDRDRKLWREIREQHPNLTNPEHHKLWDDVRTLTHETWVWFTKLQRDVVFGNIINIESDNLKLVLSNVQPVDIVVGLRSFISYLEHLGCDNITYTVEQLRG